MAKQACAGQSLSSAAAILTFYEIQCERMTAAMGIPKECALGCNARTYNPICNAHAPKLANANHGGWQGSNDEITWCAVPNREAANLFRYQRKVLVTSVQPIPKPAPELCAFQNCGRDRSHSFHYPCTSSFNCNVQNCHSFVAPQAKPVLREPKPRADGYPDVCLYCRGEKTTPSICHRCLRALSPEFAAKLVRDWEVKPAAKDIPLMVQAGDRLGTPADALSSTEAARGGEAAITKPRPPARFDLTLSERGPSAVAAAPGVEPWRPTVDEWDLLPDAETGWRR